MSHDFALTQQPYVLAIIGGFESDIAQHLVWDSIHLNVSLAQPPLYAPDSLTQAADEISCFDN